MLRVTDKSKSFLPVGLFLGIFVGSLLVLVLALHLDPRGTARFLEWVSLLVVILGVPASVAVAAVKRQYHVLALILGLGLIAAVLLCMASLQFKDLRESMQETRMLWSSFYMLAGVSLAFAATVVARNRDYRMLAALAAVVALGAVLWLARDRLPEYRSSMQEDAWAEWSTFYAFMLASLLAALALWRSLRRKAEQRTAWRWLSAATLGGISVLCFVVAAEELSWGQRLFAFQPPEVFTELNYQQEMNVHNFFKDKSLWNIPLDTKYLVVFVSLCYGLILPLAAALVALVLGRSAAGEIPSPPLYLSPCFAAVALAELTYPVKFAGEAAELLLGVTFVADGAVRLMAGSVPAKRGFVLYPLAAALALPFVAGAVTPRALEATGQGASAELATQARAELELLRQDLQDPDTTRALSDTKRLHQRIFTAARAAQLRFGSNSRFLESRPSPADEGADGQRRDRRGYFLDPWSNAYWIYHVPRRKAAIIYSFGPNRRRDTDLRVLSREEWREAALDGDDIGLTVPLGGGS